MKRLLLTAIIIFIFSIENSAQVSTSSSGLSLEPFIGISLISTRIDASQYFENDAISSKLSAAVGINLVYESSTGFIFLTGIRYLPKHMSIEMMNIPPKSNSDIWSSIDLNYNSIHVPLQVGLKKYLSKKLFIRPTVGLMLDQNFGHDYQEKVTTPDFYDVGPATIDFHNFNASLNGSIGIGYKLSSNSSIILSPQFMINSLRVEYVQGYENQLKAGGLKNSGFYFTGGITINI